ncbi:expressed unknown protein [Seminavis robusta]|uniref:Glycosyltransferase family 92 protein n=1 Tax=Seminavis robusta TaxID=568900 RepID=A0A9N8EAB4_9STRA|nr:expressed unknown protein [Seminavis robusta]|eukprot:Sro876_g214550.1 n/a (431) ;mRNA; r:31624-33041
MSFLISIEAKKQEAEKHWRRSTRAAAFVFLIIVSFVWSRQTNIVKRIQIYKDAFALAPDVLAQNQQRSVQQTTNEDGAEHDHHNSTDPSEENRHVRPNHAYPFTFAACLIARDDNLLLSEWIAFHYTVLPLRHLIIAVDPLSVTSPEPILEAFREELPDLTIDLWTGNSYWYDGRWSREKLEHFDPHNHTGEHAYIMHLQRQNAFYTTCVRQLKQGNASWTLLVDTDEFFTYNSLLPSERSGSSPMRDQLSTQEIADINDAVSSSSFPVDTFHTLRYHSHWAVGMTTNGKSLVNVHNYNGRNKVTNPHRPFDGVCDNHWVQPIQSERIPFRVHHYSGSLDTFLSRPSRTAQQWANKNDFHITGKDYSLTGWFHNFVQLVGEKIAYKLTVKTRQDAYLRWKDIKYRVEKKNEMIPLAFEYDQPGGAKNGQH